MIDTSKYEGHNIAMMSNMQSGMATHIEREANWNLVQDSPLILQALIDEREEVKRLREENERYRRLNNYLWEHRSSHWSADNDAEMDRLEMIE